MNRDEMDRGYLSSLPPLYETATDRDVRNWHAKGACLAYEAGDLWMARSFEIALRHSDIRQRLLEDRDAEIRNLQDELSTAPAWDPYASWESRP